MKTILPNPQWAMSIQRLFAVGKMSSFFLTFFLLNSLPGNVFAQVSITPSLSTITTCSSFPTDYFPLNTITVRESSSNDIQLSGSQTIELFAPANFEFQPLKGNVSFTAQGNINTATVTVSATSIKITISGTGTNKADNLTLSNVFVRGIIGPATNQQIINTSASTDINGGGAGTVYATLSSVILPTPTVVASPTSTSCSGSSTGIALSSSPSGASFVWTPSNINNVTGASAGSGNAISQTLASVLSPGTVEYLVTPILNGCAGPTTTITNTVNPVATVTPVANQNVCNNGSTDDIIFSSPTTGGSITYNWTNNNTSIGLAASGSGNISSFTAKNTTNAPVTSTITVTPTYNNGGKSCTGTPATFTITVNPTATVSAITNKTFCNGSLTSPISFSSSATGGVVSYYWENSNAEIGLAASGTGDLPSFTAVNATLAPISATITVTPVYSKNGSSCTGTARTFTMVINPTAVVNTISDQLLCNNSTITIADFTSPVSGGTVSYSWANSNSSIGLAASGAGNIGSFVAKNSGSAPLTATITVTPTFTNGGTSCTGTPTTFTITVNPTATVNAIADQYLCNNSSSAAVAFSSATTGGSIVYNWSNSNTSIGLDASGTRSLPAFITTNSTNTAATSIITVTPVYTNAAVTCEGQSSSFKLVVNPVPTVNSIQDQAVCYNSATGAVNFTSPTSGTINYSWSNNNTSTGLISNGTGSIPSFAAINNGSAPITSVITVTPSIVNGGTTCAGTASSFSIIVNPKANVSSISNRVVCNNSSVTIPGFTSTATGGTVSYSWTNNNASIGLSASGIGNIPVFTATNSANSPATATITVTASYNNSGTTCTGASTTFTITVNPTATVNPITNQTVCNDGTTAAVSFSSPATGGTVSYKWTNNNTNTGLASSGTGNIASFTGRNIGNQPVTSTITVTPIFTNGTSSCAGTSSSFTITVNPTASLNTVAHQTVCDNGATNDINFSSPTTTGTFTYAWTNNAPSIGLASSGSGNIASFTAHNYASGPFSATITVTPTYSNGGVTCEAYPGSFTITINPTASVDQVSDQVVCNNTNTIPVTFTSSTEGGSISYKWTNNTPSIGLASTGSGNLPIFTAKNTGLTPVTATITVVPYYLNGAKTCGGTPMVFSITVNPTPTITTPKDFGICNNGSVGAIDLAGGVSGTNFTWSNNNNSIGLPLSATNSLPSFTATNTGNAPVTSTVTITPFYINLGTTCTAPSTDFSITVNPTATVNPVSNQVVCNNGSVAAVNFSSPQTGGTISYKWVNTNTSIGLAATGTGNISSFMGKNSGNAPLTATITVTPVYSNAGAVCEGTPSTFTITVNPTATVTTVANQTLCNNSPSTAITFASTATGGTVTYSWTNSNSTIGLAATGNGNIASFTAKNPGNSAVTATITVTPTYTNGGATCLGTPSTFTITVHPTPSVTTIADRTICNNGSSASISITGTVAQTVYTWTNSNTSTGLSASGTGTIPAFVGKNNGNAPQVSNITITPTYTNNGKTCSANTSSFAISVNPVATVNPVAHISACNNSSVNATVFSSPTTGGEVTYTWTNSNNTIGLPSSGTGNLPLFTAINPGTTPATATITVTPSYSNGDATCSGTPYSFTITVNPTPTVNTISNQAVCANVPVSATFSGSVTGTVYNWTNTKPEIGLGASGTGNISSFNTINTGTSPIVSSITVTPVYTNDGTTCSGVAKTFTITVNPLPVPTLSGPNPICPNNTDTYITEPGMINYSWTQTGGTITNGGSTSSNTATITWGNSTSVKTIYINYTNLNGCMGATSVTVANGVNSSPTVTGPSIVCAASNGSVYTTQAGKLNYFWNIPAGGTITSGGGSNDNTATVTWNTAGSKNITVNYAEPGGCNAATATAYPVTVNPLPTATISGTTSVCLGSAQPNITFTGANGTAPYTFTYSVGGATKTVTTVSGNSVTVAQPTTTAGDFVYNLISVRDGSSTACVQAQTGSQTITVKVLPTATISGSTSVCESSAAPSVTFTGANGSAPFTFTYRINSGALQTITSATGSNSVTVAAPTAVPGTYIYSLVSVQDGSATSCVQNQTGSATIKVNPLPVAAITGSTTVCIGSASPLITLTGSVGTAPYTFTYKINGGSIQTISTVSGSSVTVPAPTNISGTFTYTVLTVRDGSSTTCSRAISMATPAVVIVDPKPIGGTLSPGITGDACSGSNSGAITVSGYLGHVVRWEQSTSGGTTWTTVSPAVTSTTLNYLNLTATTLYRAVIQNGVCGDIAYSSIANVIVTPIFTPTVYYTPSLVICVGDSVEMSASGFKNPTTSIAGGLFDEANPAGWNITSNGSATNFPANANNANVNPWSESNGPKTFFTDPASQITYNSQFDKKYAIVNGPITSTMETPVFSSVGMVSPTLDFYMAHHLLPGTIAKVEISTDGGATYSGLLATYTGDWGNPNYGFIPMQIPLTNYLNLTNLRIKFTYSSNENSSWAVDNVRLVNTYLPISYLWHSEGVQYNTQTIKVSPPIGTHIFNLVTQTGLCSITTTQYTVIVNGLPTVEPGTGSTCSGPVAQTINLPYTNPTFSPTNYSIVWNTPSNGLAAVVDAVLPASSIPIAIPAGLPAGVYTGSLYTRNNNGCISPATPFQITIHQTPIVTNQAPAPMCSAGSFTLSPANFTGTNIIPANTMFTWSKPSGTNITGLAAGSGTSFTTGVLTNTTNVPVTVTYTVTPRGPVPGSCPGAPFTIKITINPTIIIYAVPQSVTLCPQPFNAMSNTFSVVADNVTSYQWQENRGAGWVNLTNGGNYSGVNTNKLTVNNINETMEGYQYRTSLSNPSYCYAAFSTAASLYIRNVWRGSVSSDWGTPANWWGDVVPDINCEYVIVPKVAPKPYPRLTGTETQEVRNIVIRRDASVTILNSATLQVRGTIYSDIANAAFGYLDGTDGRVELNGGTPHTYVGTDSAQIIAGSLFKARTLKDLQITNPLSATVRSTPNDTLNITGCLSFGPVNNTVLNTGNNITLISIQSRTARVADITNNGKNSGNHFNGEVIVERYINSVQHGKAWEFLAIPTTGQSVKQTWMENGNKLSTGFGTQITGLGGTGAGFDQYSAAPSMKHYVPAIGGSGISDWQGIPNTGISIYNPSGYMLFVRGDRSIPGPNTPANPTRLRTKGNLITYNVSVPLANSGFTSIGNPYASAIDMSKVMPKAKGADEFFYVWASPTYGAYGYGSYITYSFVDGQYVSTPGGKVNNNIESGQAFFVQTSGVTDASISFDETVKAATSSSAIFRQAGNRPAKVARLRTNFYTINNAGGYLADGTLQEFSDEFSTTIDHLDARKISNSSENFTILASGRNLIVERRKTLTENDTLFFKMTGVARQKYRLEFIAKGMAVNGLQGYIEDNYLHTQTPLNMEDTTNFYFSVDNTKESSLPNRFFITFKQKALMPFTLSAHAIASDRNVQIGWNVTNEKHIENYVVERSTDGSHFNAINSSIAGNTGISAYNFTDNQLLPAYYYYRVKSTDEKGVETYSKVIKIVIGDGKPGIGIYPNPITNGVVHLQLLNLPAGTYNLRLMNSSGQVFYSRKIVRAWGSSVEDINWDYRMTRGVYDLELTHPDGSVRILKVVY